MLCVLLKTLRYVTLRYEKEKVESTGTEVDVLNCIDCTVDFFPFLKIINREIMGADIRERIYANFICVTD